ncbi:MAG TPA: alpha/beta fold hydrolase [Bacteriovoracaceae bacterium]|nr:alpha/beta fold hydrolase [Bacteriovoracaceae bacterium]
MKKGIAAFKTQDYTIPACDGESSIFIKQYTRGTPKLHFLIVHGALEHSGRYLDLIHFWLQHYPDVVVTIFDHLGHGRSGGARAYVPGFKVYLDDFLKVGEFVQKINDETTRTFICAHSLGGLVTLTRFLDSSYGWPYPVCGLIFSSPCIKPQKILGPLSEPLLKKLVQLSPRLHLPMIFRGKQLTRDPERANDFDTDSLIPTYMSVKMAAEVTDASHRISGLSYYLRVKNLFLIAGSDKVVDPESTRLFAHGVDKQLTEIIYYPDHYHELWNEIDRHDIFETMKNWVERTLKESA